MGGGKPQQKVELKEVKEKQTIARSQLLRGAHVFLTEGAFRQRKAYLTAKVGLAILNPLTVGVDESQHDASPYCEALSYRHACRGPVL